MSELKNRVRILMERNQLSRQQVADMLDVSLVTVHKWLSNGNMKDPVARQLASNVLCDWLWLKYGVCRIPDEITEQLANLCRDSAVVRFRRDKWYVDQMGEGLRQSFGRLHDDDVIDVDTELLCLPEFWKPWAVWAEEAFSVPDVRMAPVFDGTGALVDKNERRLQGSFRFRLITVWTDPVGETRGVLLRVPDQHGAGSQLHHDIH